MFAPLPDFTPRDPHSLWYTSSRAPARPPSLLDGAHHDASHGHHGHGHGGHSRHRGQLLDKTPLARLAADEQYVQRRRANVQNLGSGWLRPPGVPKTLHQLREERREQEEHQEAMRREQLAQDLADAEPAGMPEDGVMDDVQLDGAQDLDEDIPDAEDEFGLDDDDDDDDDGDEDGSAEGEDAIRAERENDLMTARMRSTDEAFREALIRGDPDAGDMYGSDEELREEDRGQMLDEEDLALGGDGAGDAGMGVDMDADLDDDIPEAESGGYEHTDSEAELSSDEEGGDEDEDDDDGVGFAPRTAPMGPPLSPTQRGRASTSGTRQSMDLSNILSQDESSFMESSPVQARRARHG